MSVLGPIMSMSEVCDGMVSLDIQNVLQGQVKYKSKYSNHMASAGPKNSILFCCLILWYGGPSITHHISYSILDTFTFLIYLITA